MNRASLTQTAPPDSGLWPKASILNPWVDALCVGGGSILLLAPLLLFGGNTLPILQPEYQALGTVLLNMPHFLASYRIVYRSREMITRHPWATIYVPAFLLAYSVMAVMTAVSHPVWITLMIVTAGVYLARHYTGQAWGMMASYSHLAGQPFDPTERRLIRTGLNLLLLWHVTWFFYASPHSGEVRDVIEPVFSALCLASALAACLGLAGMALYTHRVRRLPPVPALIAWTAIHLWYAAIARDARALFWVQIAHALQYLIFPIRMEINQQKHLAGGLSNTTGLRHHMVWYALVLLAVSAGFGILQHDAGTQWLTRMAGTDYGKAVSVALFAFINIHHYFTDGCIWKLRNPEVRRSLFAHLQSAKPD